MVVLLTIIGVIVTLALMGRGGAPTIVESADAISVTLSGYSTEIPYATIDSVGLRHGLDGLQGRRGAVQSGNRYAGRFAMAPYGEPLLFVDALRQPLVVIHAGSGVTLLSATDSMQAEQLAVRVRQAALRARTAAASR